MNLLVKDMIIIIDSLKLRRASLANELQKVDSEIYKIQHTPKENHPWKRYSKFNK